MKNKILLVEYSLDTIETIRTILPPDSFDLSVAGNETVARALLSKQKYDLAIVAALLPKFYGFSFCEFIKSQYPQTKVIIMGDKLAEEDQKKAAIQVKADDFVAKPLDNTKFRELVVKHLHIRDISKFSTDSIGDTTNVYFLPLLAELEKQSKTEKTPDEQLRSIIEELKREKENPNDYEIELD